MSVMTKQEGTPNDYAYYKRDWLNEPGHHSVAFILASISAESHEKDDGTTETEYQWADAGITIGDCSRQITLSIDFYNEENRINSLAKLDNLIQVFQEFREQFLIVEALAREQEERRDEERTLAEANKVDSDEDEPEELLTLATPRGGRRHLVFS